MPRKKVAAPTSEPVQTRPQRDRKPTSFYSPGESFTLKKGREAAPHTPQPPPPSPSAKESVPLPDLKDTETKTEEIMSPKKGLLVTKAELNQQFAWFYEKPTVQKKATKKKAPPVPKKLVSKYMAPHVSCEDALKKVYTDKPKVILPRALKQDTPKKAYYLGGSAGSGKSMVYKALFSSLPQNSYYYYNVDNYYEAYLELNGLLMKTKERSKRKEVFTQLLEMLPFTEGETEKEPFTEFLSRRVITSMKSILMGKAQQCIREDMEEVSRTNPTMVIDKPSAKLDMIQKELYNPLQRKGYTQYMIFVYTPLFTALTNNRRRGDEETSGRSLADHIIIDSWVNSMQNIEKLKKLFGENIFFVDNSRGTTMETYDPAEIRAKLEAEYYLDKEDLDEWVPLIAKTQEAITGLIFTDIETIKSKLGLP